MSNMYEVNYSIKGSVTVVANNEQEALEKALNVDETSTEELLDGIKENIEYAGNEAIGIDDVYELDDLGNII